jgi:hypothetical protein
MESIRLSVLVSLEEFLCLRMLSLGSGDRDRLFLCFASFAGSGEDPTEEMVVLRTYVECESRGSEDLDDVPG